MVKDICCFSEGCDACLEEACVEQEVKLSVKPITAIINSQFQPGPGRTLYFLCTADFNQMDVKYLMAFSMLFFIVYILFIYSFN